MKRHPRPELTAAEAARIGEEMREARLALGITIEDASNRLRINRRYLMALEEGRLKDLPGPAYAMGFVRSYSGALGLDADEIVRRFRDVTGTGGQKGDLVFPEPVPGRGIPAAAVVGVGVVLVVAGYVAWYNWSGSGLRSVDNVPPLPPRLEETAQAGERLRESEAPPPAADPVPAPAAAPAAPPSPPPMPEPPAPRISLRARGETSIQIRDTRDNNRVILDRVMRNGDSMAVPNREGLQLTVSQAQNLEIVVDGQPSAFMGPQPGPRRGIPLEPDRLRPRPATAPAQQRPQRSQQRPAQQQAPAAQPAAPAQPAGGAPARP